MTIEEAKSQLEDLLLLHSAVNGIGIIEEDGAPTIEVAVKADENEIQAKIDGICPPQERQEFTIKVVRSRGFEVH